MTININPVDFRGFALGAPSAPQLPNVGALGLQAVQMGMSQQNAKQEAALAVARIRQADEMALRQNMLDRARLAQQGQQFDKSLRLDRRKLGLLEQQAAVEQSYKDRALGIDQQRFGLDERKQNFQEQLVQKQEALETMKLGVEQLSARRKEDLNNIGAFAAQAQVALGQETDPTKANLLRNELTDQAVALGIVPADQAKQLKQLSLTQFKQATGMLAFQAGKAKEIQALTKEKKGDVSLTVGPDGSLQYNSKATTANVTKSQEALLEAEEGLAQLEPYMDPPEEFFGLAAGKQTTTYLRELGKVIPGVGADPKDVEQLGQYTEYNANAKLSIMKTARALAGARFSDTDLAMVEQIMPQVGPTHTKAEYMAKTALVKRFLENSKKAREEILSTGNYKIGTEEYDKAFSAKLPSIIEQSKKDVAPSNDDPLGILN